MGRYIVKIQWTRRVFSHCDFATLFPQHGPGHVHQRVVGGFTYHLPVYVVAVHIARPARALVLIQNARVPLGAGCHVWACAVVSVLSHVVS